MIWVIVSSRSCFCWLCRASPSSATKNIINLIFSIDHLVMSMCTVISCIIGRVCLLWPVCSLGKTVSLCPASFCTPRPNLPVTPGIPWLPSFAFQSITMKRTSFLMLVLEGLVGLHRTVQRSASSAFLDRAKTWVTVILNALPWKLTEIILSFLRVLRYCILDSFVDYEGCSISFKRFLPTE